MQVLMKIEPDFLDAQIQLREWLFISVSHLNFAGAINTHISLVRWAFAPFLLMLHTNEAPAKNAMEQKSKSDWNYVQGKSFIILFVYFRHFENGRGKGA